MQHQFKLKLNSGLWATGFMDIMGGIRQSDGTITTTRSIRESFTKDLLDHSGNITNKTEFDSLVDKLLSDTKHKYVIAVYGVKVY